MVVVGTLPNRYFGSHSERSYPHIPYGPPLDIYRLIIRFVLELFYAANRSALRNNTTSLFTLLPPNSWPLITTSTNCASVFDSGSMSAGRSGNCRQWARAVSEPPMDMVKEAKGPVVLLQGIVDDQLLWEPCQSHDSRWLTELPTRRSIFLASTMLQLSVPSPSGWMTRL